MVPAIIKWIIIILAFMNTGYMAFDGSHALIKGDYIRPAEGEYAGQLGPWAKLAEKVGIEPMSTGMKLILVSLGIVGVAITVCFVIDLKWAWTAMVLYNFIVLWYLVFGTLSSITQFILLIILRYLR